MTINNTRRSLLASIATMSVAGLAGCSNNTGTDDSNPTNSDQAKEIESIEGQGTKLTVTLADRGVADTLQLNHEGQKVATADVSNAQTGTFNIGVDYTPGDHSVLAIQDDDIIAETTVDLSPELELVDSGLGKRNPDEFPDLTSIKYRAYFTIKNTGKGADQATKLVSPDTPHELTKDREAPGMVTEESGMATPAIPAGSTTTLYSEPILAGAPPHDEWNCGQSHSMKIQIQCRHSDQISREYNFDSNLITEEYDSYSSEPTVMNEKCELSKMTTD